MNPRTDGGRTMSVLVAYGTKHGSTREIAEAIADELQRSGVEAEVMAAEDVRDLAPFEAVVLGGALYMGRWHRAARSFGRWFAPLLLKRQVWLFSSGPLDHSADVREIPPVPGVAKLAAEVGARGHATFGGSLAPDVTGFPAKAMAKKVAGDYRDFDAIRAWARGISDELGARPIAA
jgi:menaquinone-dependent protoporphyrinogen oxidase